MGSIDALVNLGFFMEHGLEIDYDFQRALVCYGKSMSSGHSRGTA
jgi:TPR repeat protein